MTSGTLPLFIPSRPVSMQIGCWSRSRIRYASRIEFSSKPGQARSTKPPRLLRSRRTLCKPEQHTCLFFIRFTNNLSLGTGIVAHSNASCLIVHVKNYARSSRSEIFPSRLVKLGSLFSNLLFCAPQSRNLPNGSRRFSQTPKVSILNWKKILRHEPRQREYRKHYSQSEPRQGDPLIIIILEQCRP